MAESLDALLARQNQLLTRRQSLTYFTAVQVDARLGHRWQVILPGVYATFTGQITEQQRSRAALLLAGEGSMLNDIDALGQHRLPFLPTDPRIRVLVDATVQRASREFVVIRRTSRLPRPLFIGGFPVAPVPRAVAELALRHRNERESLAVAAAAVQLGKATIDQLAYEAEHGPARGRPRFVRIINELEAGTRSVAESDFRELVRSSLILPEPLWNPLLLLPNGTKISPDALWVEAGLVHEVNGRQAHAPEKAGEDVFEDMQRRHDTLTTTDLTVLHNAPRRIANEGPEVLTQLETCYLRELGRGLPPGVVILRAGPPGLSKQWRIA